jgi:hypothetical protein
LLSSPKRGSPAQSPGVLGSPVKCGGAGHGRSQRRLDFDSVSRNCSTCHATAASEPSGSLLSVTPAPELVALLQDVRQGKLPTERIDSQASTVFRDLARIATSSGDPTASALAVDILATVAHCLRDQLTVPSLEHLLHALLSVTADTTLLELGNRDMALAPQAEAASSRAGAAPTRVAAWAAGRLSAAVSSASLSESMVDIEHASPSAADGARLCHWATSALARLVRSPREAGRAGIDKFGAHDLLSRSSCAAVANDDASMQLRFVRASCREGHAPQRESLAAADGAHASTGLSQQPPLPVAACTQHFWAAQAPSRQPGSLALLALLCDHGGCCVARVSKHQNTSQPSLPHS